MTMVYHIGNQLLYGLCASSYVKNENKKKPIHFRGRAEPILYLTDSAARPQKLSHYSSSKPSKHQPSNEVLQNK